MLSLAGRNTHTAHRKIARPITAKMRETIPSAPSFLVAGRVTEKVRMIPARRPIIFAEKASDV